MEEVSIICYMRVNSKDQLAAWRNMKNIAKIRGLGTYKVNSPEQRLGVKRRCEEFERDDRMTREDVIEYVRQCFHKEFKWDGRISFTPSGVKIIK